MPEPPLDLVNRPQCACHFHLNTKVIPGTIGGGPFHREVDLGLIADMFAKWFSLPSKIWSLLGSSGYSTFAEIAEKPDYRAVRWRFEGAEQGQML